MAQAKRGFRAPAEITDYFDQKSLRPAFSWQDVFGEEHAHAFTVAKALEIELLGAFQSTIAESLAEGETIENWKARLEPELKRLGWWGPRLVSDPTGRLPDRAVDFSSPRRLQTSYWSNMRAARAAGQWQRIERTKQALPYILYVRTASIEPRPEHLAFEGIILPVDDAFWRTHFPPNGWGCKCSVRQISAREATRLGYKLDDGGPQIVWRQYLNKRTGELVKVPEGIDPGWQTNPGLARARTLVARLTETLDQAGPELARKAIAEIVNSRETAVLANLSERVRIPVAVAETAASELNAASPLLIIDTATLRKKMTKHSSVRFDTLASVQEMIDTGQLIDEGRGNARTVFFAIGPVWWEIVLVRSANGFLRIQTLHKVRAADVTKALKKAGLE
ncbi:phage Mu protein F like protein [Hoeflea marina]|uniref:Phage Mu protein F like protein n=1 Tax=Hoeflea marina TaxID=274592 RepID=A0A317PE26_9HYPH|nr:phage minor head protein [Hoeflea marina]PWV97718.1 phage Mu protein F like protein [Hoeflea marina]